MTGNKIVPGQGAVSKNPPSEFTIEELADWLARLNPEFGYSRDKQCFRKIIEDALNTGDLTIGGSPQYPLPGRCVDCHRDYLAPKVIPITDIEQWCINKGVVFFTTGKRKKQELADKQNKPIHGNSKKARDQLDAAFYDFFEKLLQGKINAIVVEKLIKETTGELTTNGLGNYLMNFHNAPPSAGKIITNAIKKRQLINVFFLIFSCNFICCMMQETHHISG